MLKNFRKELMTRLLSLKVLRKATKVDLTANICKLKILKNKKPSFLNVFECYNQ